MKKRVLSALLALCLTLSLAGAAFAENEPSGDSSSAVSQAVSSVESEPQTQDETVSSDSASGEDQTAAKTENTPAPTETPAASDVVEEEPESTASEAEVEISTAETAQEPSYPAQDFEAAVDGADMTVNVSAPEGALPADVALTASLVGSSEDNADDQAVADVAAELDDADVEYDGFVALDISFVDADGNKVEPLQPVSVNFTLPAELLPEDVDASTLEVQHLKEDAETEEVVAVETVADTADATEGTVTVDTPVATLSEDAEATLPADAEVAAEFEVDGFSIFTITWQNIEIKAVCVDERGVRIDGNENAGNIKISQNTALDATFAPAIEGYSFVEARVVQQYDFGLFGSSYESVVATHLDKDWYNLFLWYQTEDGEWHRFENLIGDASLYLVYSKDEPADPGQKPDAPDPISPLYSKTATKNDDGTYDLSLSVTGAASSQEHKLPLDVVFVIDESASMNDPFTGYNNRMAAVKSSVKELTDTLTENSDDISVRYSVVKFSGLSATKTVLGWTTAETNAGAASQVDNALNQINPPDSAGTNYQAGLREAINLLESARSDATTCVIFMTDGQPTYRTWDGAELGSGNSDSDGLNIAGAEAEVKYLNANLFYCVGVGDDFAKEDSTAAQNLNKLCNAANAGTTGWYSATDTSSLENAFNEMVGTVTTITVKNVTITDELSSNVDVVEGATPEITVENAAGSDVTESEFANLISDKADSSKIYASLNEKTLTLNFPDAYKLQEDYTYKVTLKIEPSEKAKEQFRENGYDYPKDSVAGEYTDVGEPGTGTHEGQGGFFSNVAESAILTYTCLNTINGEEIESEKQTREYSMPVIQVDETSLTISKAFAGSWENFTDEQKADAISKIKFTIYESGSATPVQSGISLEKNREGYYTAVVDGLTVGKTYSVTETCSAPDGYDVTVDDNSKTTKALVANPSQNMISFTNTYTPATASLSITKRVDGYQSGDKIFEITVQGPNEVAGKSFADASGNVVASFDRDAVATLSLKDGDTVTITGLPKGKKFKVEESASSQGDIDTKPDDSKKDYYLDKTSYQIDGKEASENSEQFELNADTAVTVTNSYKPYMTLVVKKIVTGEMGSNSDPFDFTARYTSNNDKVELLSSQDPTDDKNDFKLTGGSSVTLINLKEGQEFTITEAGTTNGYTFKEIDVDSSVLVKKDTENSNGYVTGTSYITIKVPAANAPTALGTVTFTNERKAVAPTGLEDNHTKPFGLMVGVAVMAGLALAGGTVVRRRRRWME